MNEFTLDELFTAYFDKEFDVPQQNIQPTCRHKRKMRKIFDAFSENQRKRNFSNIQKRFENGKAEHKHRLKPKQRIVITIAAVICAILFTGFVVKYISDSFSGTVYKDNTQLFAIRTDNCPEIIEDQYFLSAVPDGFEISEAESTPYGHLVIYTNKVTEQIISFEQTVKTSFDVHLNTEKYKLHEVSVSGYNGVIMDSSDEENEYSTLIWDSKDYIFTLTGDLSENDMIKLAEANEAQGFVIIQ